MRALIQQEEWDLKQAIQESLRSDKSRAHPSRSSASTSSSSRGTISTKKENGFAVPSKSGDKESRVHHKAFTLKRDNTPSNNDNVNVNHKTGSNLAAPAVAKKPKIPPQRKFAQGAGNYTPVSTPVKVGSIPRIPTTEVFQSIKPNTDDFLTFLCFQGSAILPPRLDFCAINRQAILDKKKKMIMSKDIVFETLEHDNLNHKKKPIEKQIDSSFKRSSTNSIFGGKEKAIGIGSSTVVSRLTPKKVSVVKDKSVVDEKNTILDKVKKVVTLKKVVVEPVSSTIVVSSKLVEKRKSSCDSEQCPSVSSLKEKKKVKLNEVASLTKQVQKANVTVSSSSTLKVNKGKGKAPLKRVTRSVSRATSRSDTDKERERQKIKEKILELERVQSFKRFASDSSLNSSSSSSSSSESLPDLSPDSSSDIDSHRITRSIEHFKQIRALNNRSQTSPNTSSSMNSTPIQMKSNNNNPNSISNNARDKKKQSMTLRSRTIAQRY